MILPKKTAKLDQELSLAQRRAYMQLPLEEERLTAQADQMGRTLRAGAGAHRTHRLVGGDIVEP